MLLRDFRPFFKARRIALTLLGADLSSYRSIEKVSKPQGDVILRLETSSEVTTIVPGQYGGFGYKHYLPARHLYSIEGAQIRGREALVFSSRLLIAESSSWPPQEALRDVGREWVGSRRTVKANAIPLPQSSYYHWLVEDLPSFLIALMNRPEATIATHWRPPLYVSSFLDFLDAKRVVFFKRSTIADQVTFNSKAGTVGVPQPADIAFIRNYFGVGQTSPEKPKVIYVSRLGSSRSPKGEAKLQSSLSMLGVRVIRSESLTFVEQLELYSEATLILGPHGAGLANMVFAPQGEVVELGNPLWPNPCFEILSRLCGHQHELITVRDEIGDSERQAITERVRKHIEAWKQA